ncbi:MAG: hypothetical protein C0461_07550 [Brevundimonas sp.]|nr:hypothetical protein [Brevundimonas sp.]
MTRSVRTGDSAFSPLVVIAAALVGVMALAGLGVLSAYAPELRSGNDGGDHALSRAATGFGALPPLLRELGEPVLLSRGALTEASSEGLLILTPTGRSTANRIDDIAHDGATLIVLPKWVTAPDPARTGWVMTVGMHPAADALSALPEELRQGAGLVARQGREQVIMRRPNGASLGAPVEIEGLRTLSGNGWVPVATDEHGDPVLAMHAETGTYVLSDPDLINTQGLKTLEGAQTAVALLGVIRAQGAPLIFDLTLHGFQRTRSLLRLMLEPPLLGMTLVMAALAVFAGLQAAVRFGPTREPARVIALGKRGLADNTAGLVRLARREHHLATPYALLMRVAAARAIGAPRSLDDEQLNAFLDRVGRSSGATETYSALAEQAQAARTPGDLMRVANALYRWNQELTRAHQ